MAVFSVKYLSEAIVFLQSLEEDVRDKVNYNIRKVAGGIVDKELFKKLDNTNIWEFRTMYNGMAYRLFAFWDTNQEAMVIATHGIIKKTQKTPTKEIAKAERIRELYFNNKKRNS
jgi:phage-related protein